MNIKDVILIMITMGFFNILCVLVGYFICTRSNPENVTGDRIRINDILSKIINKEQKYKEEDAFVPGEN